ncbi:ABC transporter permease [Oricola sp.]|uniref:ABC transporter permease n=1 Tax=Oricola sp. TaxID=1979950 RepID=UPI0025FB6EE6|nr:ABC transporter permease [Oricola sp.]MCI5078639.1 ABC transporter permease [Oricola sp.]
MTIDTTAPTSDLASRRQTRMDPVAMADAMGTAGDETRSPAPQQVMPRLIAHFHRASGHFGGQVLTFILTIAAALVASVPMIWLAGSDLWLTTTALFGGALGSGPAIAETMVQMIPLLIAGLAVAVAFHASLFNIGVEGQLLFGGLVAGIVGATVNLPPVLLMIACILAGMIGGALFALIPALLKAYRGAHEVVTTIMMNFVAVAVSEYAVAPSGPFVASDQPSATDRVPEGTQLPIIWDGTRLHAGLLVALAAVAIVTWVLYRTPIGFRLRLMGANQGAARASGVSIERMTILALLASGALGGLAGAVQVLGVYGRFYSAFSPGYGFDAIAVALLGALSPIGVVASGFFFAVLHAGSVPLQAIAGISREMVGVVSGLVVAFVAAQPAMLRLWSGWRKPAVDDRAIETGAETPPAAEKTASMEMPS